VPARGRDAERAAASRLHVALLGDADESLKAVLEDVLAELGLATDSDLTHVPALVLAFVTRDDAVNILTAARTFAARAPIVAVSALTDEPLAEISVAFGAAAYYALDRPLDRLRAVVRTLLPDRVSTIEEAGRD
jgi:hypothetical protein